jgi:protein-disulfide isomerase/uncharacterized membrane protein
LITYITGAPIACGIVQGCDVVRASKWAYTMGIPRPLLGVVFYLAILCLLVVRVVLPKHRPRLWTALTILATFVGFIESAFLTFVQWADIGAFCIWCLTSAAVATVLFPLSFFVGEEDLDAKGDFRELKVIFYSFCSAVFVSALLLFALLWQKEVNEPPQTLPQDAQSLILPDGIPFEGPATATVTIVEFADIPCPVCRAFEPVIEEIRQTYAGRIRFALRTFMLPEVHANAKESAIAVQCAGKQDAFLPYTHAAILNQQRLSRADLVGYAEALSLDASAFETCLDDPAVATFVENERSAGEYLGVDSTPTIFVNDIKINGIPTKEQLTQVIEDLLYENRIR